MNISIFDVMGPVMIGPSSSHTAGAARLANAAARIADGPFTHVSFGLHGSFAKTYKGHGTDKALVAGVLGFHADDEQIRNAFAIAKARNISFEFYETELEGMHDNSACITFLMADGKTRKVAGSSTGGGQIVICRIDQLNVELTLQSPTLIISQYDKKGVISQITQILAENNINIGVMKLSRTARGQTAICVIETDDLLTKEIVQKVSRSEHVIAVQALNPES